jgi:hypothetical protein
LSRLHLTDALLQDAWSHYPERIPAPILAQLAAERRLNALQSAAGMLQRDEVLRALGARGIPCLFLKGAALASVWYGDLSLRPFLDIDVLVPPGRLAQARDALLDVGYVLDGGPEPEQHHHATPLRHPDLPCAVELHRRPTFLPFAGWPAFAVLLSRAVTVPDGGSEPIPTLGPEDTILQLSLHLLADVWSRGGWRLRRLADLDRHLRAFVIDWELAAELARQVGVLAGCRAVLTLAATLLGSSIPDAMMDRDAGARLRLHPIPLASPDGIPYRRLYERAVGWSLGRAKAGAGTSIPRSPQPHPPSFRHDLRRLGDLVRQSISRPRATAEQVLGGFSMERDLARTRADVQALLTNPGAQGRSNSSPG